MKCPSCENINTKVIDSRLTERGYTIRRRRECESCEFRFTTYEYVYPKKVVIKKNGIRQDYDRQKLEQSIHISCKKRPISFARGQSSNATTTACTIATPIWRVFSCP